VTFLGSLRKFLGPELRNFFSDTKPALMQVIDKEFAKVADQLPPAPKKAVRGEDATKAAGGGGQDSNKDYTN